MYTTKLQKLEDVKLKHTLTFFIVYNYDMFWEMIDTLSVAINSYCPLVVITVTMYIIPNDIIMYDLSLGKTLQVQ